jgi:hypothetical protein
MAKVLLVVVYACMMAPGTRTQEIVGTWQRTVAAAQPERVVLRVAKDETGALRASSYRPGTGLNVLPMTRSRLRRPWWRRHWRTWG